MDCTSKQNKEIAPITNGRGAPVGIIYYPRVATLYAVYYSHWSDSRGGREVRKGQRCDEDVGGWERPFRRGPLELLTGPRVERRSHWQSGIYRFHTGRGFFSSLTTALHDTAPSVNGTVIPKKTTEAKERDPIDRPIPWCGKRCMTSCGSRL